MDWEWSEHFQQQLSEREIEVEKIEYTLNNPDEIADGKDNRKIYQKIFENKLLRIITENNRLITVYKTKRISKYMGKQK